jgi:hypothetical protein
MATSTLIQYLETTAVTGLGVSVGVGAASMNRRQTETFIAKENLVVGDFVAFDLAATADGDVSIGVFKADGNSAPVRTPFGVVLGSAETSGKLTAGSRINVCISGVCDALVGDNGGAGNALGVVLQITNTAGVADLAAATSAQPVVAVLAEVVAPAAGVTLKRVVVRKSF